MKDAAVRSVAAGQARAVVEGKFRLREGFLQTSIINIVKPLLFGLFTIGFTLFSILKKLTNQQTKNNGFQDMYKPLQNEMSERIHFKLLI